MYSGLETDGSTGLDTGRVSAAYAGGTGLGFQAYEREMPLPNQAMLHSRAFPVCPAPSGPPPVEMAEIPSNAMPCGHGAAASAGYRHPGFACSFATFGTPVALPVAGGGVLLRDIPGTALRDAMGPYPLLACGDYGALAADLRALPADVVAVSAV